MFLPDFVPRVSDFIRKYLRVFALFCMAALSLSTLASCGGDSCFIATWNFPGPISTGNKTCGLNTGTGNVTVRLITVAPSAASPMSPNLLHIFISLQGIEAHQDAGAGENSPGWEELAPNLVNQPLQIDLMARPAQSCASNPISRALVTAGAYKQIRLRLVPDRVAEEVLAPKENACGEMGFHCVVTTSNRLRPLIIDTAAPEIRIAPNRIAGGFFHVLPDADTSLAIEFNPFASFAFPSGDAVQLAPTFSVDSAPSCSSLRLTEQ
ncbi:MAG: DUF4382 domain-containing protein [Candidatus Acidiferrales bacterium]